MSRTLLDPHRVKPFPRQPRKRFRGIKQLAESIQEAGQCTPIAVSPLEEPDPDYDAQLTDGERRLKACLLLKRPIRVTWEPGGECPNSTATRFARSVAANFCRQPHDAMEIAEAIRELRGEGRSAQEISRIFGKHITWVYQHAMLLDLAPEVQAMLCRAAEDEGRRQTRRPGRMTSGLAILLSPLSHAQQAKVVGQIAAKNLGFSAARDFILRTKHASGCQHRTRSKGAKPAHAGNPVGALETATGVYRLAVDRVANLSYAKLQEAVGEMAPARAQSLGNVLAELCDNLQGVRVALRKRGEQ